MKRSTIMVSSIGIIASAFIVFAIIFSGESKPTETKTDELQLPKNGIYLNSTDGSYFVGQKIGFSVISVLSSCEDVFEVEIVNYDHSKVLWQESGPTNCTTLGYQKISRADFPTKGTITIDEAGEYWVLVDLRVGSHF
ncbi:MAG: hypothetical protein ACREAK_01185, partial [Nitrosarchaeum sp.]